MAAFGDAGHAFPAIALARALHRRGNQVVIETWERWRQPIENLGLSFEAAEGYKVFPPPPSDGSGGPTAADAAIALSPLFERFKPHLVVSDILTVAPALAAEVAGVRRATLVPHIWPVHQPGLPFFAFGMMPPRTAIGRAAWRRGGRVLENGLRRGRDELNAERIRLGLAPTTALYGGISDRLALVATLPQLEYPRNWPEGVEVVGPLHFEIPYPDIELPPGDRPLVLVAPSTAQDPEGRLLRATLEGLADEPVRVVATTNHNVRGEAAIVPPANAVCVEWLSYSQLMPAASLVICHGGHGTVARALAAGVPTLVCPAVGDMAETGIRIAWSGCGLNLPFRLTRPGPIRWATRRLLSERRFAGRAAAAASWAAGNDSASHSAGLVERAADAG